MSTGKINFSWDMHWSCNYRCPYCWWDGRWDELGRRNIYPGTEAVLDAWKRIYKLYGEVHIDIAGGEPTIYPDFIGLLNGLLDYHTVTLMTNLSCDIAPLKKNSMNGKHERVKIGATYHPLFSKQEEFLRKSEMLRRDGMSIGVLYLAYPQQIEDIPRLKKEFASRNIYFSVTTFWGVYGGREYPQSYTPGELEIINTALGKRKKEKFQTKPVTTKGKLCNAGCKYAVIHPDGDVIRCGGGSWRGENIIIGNIFNADFRLKDGPEPCHSEYCPCNEWAFLLLEE